MSSHPVSLSLPVCLCVIFPSWEDLLAEYDKNSKKCKLEVHVLFHRVYIAPTCCNPEWTNPTWPLDRASHGFFSFFVLFLFNSPASFPPYCLVQNTHQTSRLASLLILCCCRDSVFKSLWLWFQRPLYCLTPSDLLLHQKGPSASVVLASLKLHEKSWLMHRLNWLYFEEAALTFSLWRFLFITDMCN